MDSTNGTTIINLRIGTQKKFNTKLENGGACS
jgi:hypothetical protein